MAVVELKDNCNEIVAKLPGVKAALRHAAGEGAAKARGTLLAHRDTGASRITVTHGELDYFVNLDDTPGDRAAAAIEFGRSGTHPSQGVRALSKAFGLTTGPRRLKNATGNFD